MIEFVSLVSIARSHATLETSDSCAVVDGVQFYAVELID